MTDMRFGEYLRTLRQQRGWSLRELGGQICFHHGYIGRVEQGCKFPEERFAELADQVLDARGQVLASWSREAAARQQVERTGKLIGDSVADSLQLIHEADQGGLVDLQQQIEDLSIRYLSSPPAPMLAAAVELRRRLIARIRAHDYRIGQLSDLYRSVALVQGILAYAALDLGHSGAASVHASAAWAMAERIGDNEMRAWVRGTESLIARFDGKYEQALAFVQDGLRYRCRGTGRIRLLSGVAQCRANLGDSVGANATLDQAEIERLALDSTDTSAGLFTFSVAKQHYYAGSSLIWLSGQADARRAVEGAQAAITAWQGESSQTRSLKDESLAHIYLAKAQLQLGSLDACAEALEPVLRLSAEGHISWITKRLTGLAQDLTEGPYAKSGQAGLLRDRMLHAVSKAATNVPSGLVSQ